MSRDALVTVLLMSLQMGTAGSNGNLQLRTGPKQFLFPPKGVHGRKHLPMDAFGRRVGADGATAVNIGPSWVSHYTAQVKKHAEFIADFFKAACLTGRNMWVLLGLTLWPLSTTQWCPLAHQLLAWAKPREVRNGSLMLDGLWKKLPPLPGSRSLWNHSSWWVSVRIYDILSYLASFQLLLFRRFDVKSRCTRDYIILFFAFCCDKLEP